MKLFYQFFVSLSVSFTLLGEQSLFNGKDLEGWDGNPIHWSVEDGAIVGVNTKENPTKGNTFLIWKGGNLKNFDLTLECIRLFYENKESPLSFVFQRYIEFFNLFCDFKGYVDFFLLQDLSAPIAKLLQDFFYFPTHN